MVVSRARGSGSTNDRGKFQSRRQGAATIKTALFKMVFMVVLVRALHGAAIQNCDRNYGQDRSRRARRQLAARCQSATLVSSIRHPFSRRELVVDRSR